MIRKTLTIFSLIGLLLSVGLWGASYWGPAYVSNSGRIRLTLFNGFVSGEYLHTRFVVYQGRGLTQDTGPNRLIPSKPMLWTPGLKLRGFQGFSSYWLPRWNSNSITHLIGVPFWVFLLFFGGLLFKCHPIRHHRHRTRRKLGLCVKCGYDLRASKEICPECGQEFEKT